MADAANNRGYRANNALRRSWRRVVRVVGVLVFTGYPGAAQAYVDPGVIATLYQLVYVLVFGLLLGLVTKPMALFRRLAGKLKAFFSSRGA